jgi:hypothetical protein
MLNGIKYPSFESTLYLPSKLLNTSNPHLNALYEIQLNPINLSSQESKEKD